MRIEDKLWFKEFAVERMSDAAFWMGSDARIIYVNEAACHSLGYSKEELLSMTVHDFDPLFPQDMWSQHWKELKEKQTFTFESRHKTKDGRVFPVEITANYVEFAGKEYNCAFGRDITHRKHTEEALRDSEERFRNLMEYVPESIQGYTLEGTIFFWNKASEIIYGYTAEEAIGKYLGDLIVPSDLKPLFRECLEIAKKIKQSGEFMPSGELMLLHKEGHLIPVYSIHTAVYIEGKEPLLYCIDVDLSKQKQTEDTLRQNEKELIKRVEELEDFYNMAISRELRMIELKKENNELKEKLIKYEEQ